MGDYGVQRCGNPVVLESVRYIFPTIINLPSVRLIHAVVEHRHLEERRKHSDNPDMSDVLEGIQKKARDNARTPVQVRKFVAKSQHFADLIVS